MYDKPFSRDFTRPEAKLPEEQLPREVREEPDMKVYEGKSSEEYSHMLEHVYSPEARRMYEKVLDIADDVQAAGGRMLLVGGVVRDEIMGQLSKDFDVEVYGLHPEVIERIAHRHGRVDTVGKQFGILKLTDGSDFDIDISLPRMDSKTGVGHKGFFVQFDPDMSIAEAARRRDFTFNALAKDPLTGEIFDAFGGVEDLRNRTLRVTDPERFVDDAMRVMRGAQFVGRLGLKIEPESMKLMQGMMEELGLEPFERMKTEWEKLLLKSPKPSIGLQALMDIGVIEELYPELASLPDTPQELAWHPEGDVWTHTLMVADSARRVIDHERLEGDTARVTMWGALCHDLGKPMTTKFEDGAIRSRQHEAKGEEPTRTFLKKVGIEKKMIEKVVTCVTNHLWPSVQYFNVKKGNTVSDGAFRKLATRLDPATIAELTYVSEADHMGRGPFLDADHKDQFLLPDPYVAGDWTRKRALEIGIYEEKPASLIRGTDLLSFGFKPGMSFGEAIRLSDSLRDDFAWNHEQVMELLGQHDTLLEALFEMREIVSEK